MAELVLWRDALPDKRLPPLCMRCGAPSCVVVEHCFLWARGDAAGLWGSLFNLARHDRENVEVPLCQRHRNLFRNRTLLVVLAFIAPLIFLAGLALFNRLAGVPPPGGQRAPAVARVKGMLVIGFGLSLVYVLFTMFTWREAAIRAVALDENYVALTGVSEKFVQAIEGPADTAREEFAEERREHQLAEGPASTVREEFTEDRRRRRSREGAALLVFGVVSFLLPIVGIQFRVLDQLGELRPWVSGAFVVAGLSYLTRSSEGSSGSR